MKQKKIHNIEKPGFKVPDGYFDNLDDRIMNHVNLSEIGNSGFELPEGYLDSFEDRVMNTINSEKPVRVIQLFSKRNLIYASSVAAAVLLLLNLSIFQTNSWELEAQTMENYIIDEAISSYEIAALLDDDDLIEENFVDHDLSEENIENYVLDNMDIEEIILE